MKAIVTVTLRQGVLDPAGKAVSGGLRSMGFDEVGEVRLGKLIEVELADGASPAAAKARVEEMCRRLLANPVIEDFHVTIEG